jgi:hypothetical protein
MNQNDYFIYVFLHPTFLCYFHVTCSTCSRKKSPQRHPSPWIYNSSKTNQHPQSIPSKENRITSQSTHTSHFTNGLQWDPHQIPKIRINTNVNVSSHDNMCPNLQIETRWKPIQKHKRTFYSKTLTWKLFHHFQTYLVLIYV